MKLDNRGIDLEPLETPTFVLLSNWKDADLPNGILLRLDLLQRVLGRHRLGIISLDVRLTGISAFCLESADCLTYPKVPK